MKFDIETIFIILIIAFLIHNYYNGDCYRLREYNMNKEFNYDSDKYYNQRSRFVGFPTAPKLPKAESSFNKMPEILLEGLDNNIESNDITLPHEEILNDRYNPLITNFNDSQLQHIIDNSSSNNQAMESSNYNDLLLDDVQKNMLLDMDSKLYKKSQRNQKLAKDSKTIASNFGRNALIETYKNEIDFYQKEKSPWWEENIN
jgi:hypothetical protein